MSTSILKIMFVAISILMVGCATGPAYNQPAPEIDTARNSGFTTISDRDPESVRYEPETTLRAGISKRAEVDIIITFDYRSSRGRRGQQTRDCYIRVQGSDSSVHDEIRCRADPAGNTFMIRYKSDHGIKAFDIESLNGRWVGFRPFYYQNFLGGFSVSSRRVQHMRYEAVSEDPFNL